MLMSILPCLPVRNSNFSLQISQGYEIENHWAFSLWAKYICVFFLFSPQKDQNRKREKTQPEKYIFFYSVAHIFVLESQQVQRKLDCFFSVVVVVEIFIKYSNDIQIRYAILSTRDMRMICVCIVLGCWPIVCLPATSIFTHNFNSRLRISRKIYFSSHQH